MHLSTPLVALLLSSAPLAQSVAWVVSPSDPTADFPDIQSAIDAAANGDSVILRSGSYDNFEIDGKALTVVADDGVTANVLGFGPGDAFVRVVNLSLGQTVVLRGLHVISGQVFGSTVAVRLADNAGTVWIEDTTIGMFNPFSQGVDDLHGIRVENSDSVLLVDCDVDAHRASEALSIDDSTVYVYGGRYEGGTGATNGAFPAVYHDAGHGARLDGGALLAFGADFIGGRGLDANPFICDPPTAGGDGVRLMDGGFTELDLLVAAGAGGSGGPCGQPDGASGLPVNELGGTRSTFGSHARSLSMNSPVYVGDTLTHTFTGSPGEVVFTVYAASLVPPTFAPQYAGPAILGNPHFFLKHGVVGAGGTLVTSLVVPDFGLEAFSVFFQPLFVTTPSLEIRIGGPSATTVIASSFAP